MIIIKEPLFPSENDNLQVAFPQSDNRTLLIHYGRALHLSHKDYIWESNILSTYLFATQKFYSFNYEERNGKLDLFLMPSRRLRGDLMLTFHVHHQKIGFRQSGFCEVPFRDIVRYFSFKLLQKRVNCQRRRDAFSITAVPFLNHLPAELYEAATLTVFKINLN